ncbi:MAG: CRTAC1 family protein [Planctomycetes bacterium]|nr:CRTAC1 family protein [Planctomycetota bacterium]
MRSFLKIVVFSVTAAASISFRAYPQSGTPPVTFKNKAKSAGVDNFGLGRAAGMIDLDGDGLLDLICADSVMNNVFYRQTSGHSFSYANQTWNYAVDNRHTYGVLAADFDNDGDNDVLFINGGFHSVEKCQFLRNDINSNGILTDISAATGDLCGLSASGVGGTVVDYDLDGDLDIFISHAMIGSAMQTCNLYRNNGGLTFSDVAPAAGITQLGDFRFCGSGDINNDGFTELGASNTKGENIVYKNNGIGGFSEVATAIGVTSPNSTYNFGIVFEDFDNDGWMDIYVAKHYPLPLGTSELFKNNGNGTFTNVSAASGIGTHTDMGHNTGDLDGDGYPDIFIGTGSPHANGEDWARLYMITPSAAGGFTATDVSSASGIWVEGKTHSHGSAFGDYNNDGFLDMYMNNGGPESNPPTMQENNFLWQNQGNQNSWIEMDLVGVISNRSAVGARSVAITSTGRSVYRYLAAGKGFSNTDSPTQHFGVGMETAMDRIEIAWPSGIRQIVLNPTLKTHFKAVETGLRMLGDATLGSLVTVQGCGASSYVTELYASVGLTWEPFPTFGGIKQIADPIFPVASFSLDSLGMGGFSFTIPSDPQLLGVKFYVQSWTHLANAPSGGSLSNIIEIEIH